MRKEKEQNNMSFSTYTIEQYKKDIDKYGLKKVWDEIIKYRKKETVSVSILETHNFGELYEIGLAYENKINKKEQGKYYTPEDVATLLSSFLKDLDGENICDVCCGTGNLIHSFLRLIGFDKARDLILNKKLYLYDMDELAMNICKNIIGLEYGIDVIDNINCIKGDFLSKKILLPENCKVISNPPYFKIKNNDDSWKVTDVIKKSRDLYSAFIEKIVKNSKSSVIISPFSFIGSDKFYSLRHVLNNYNGMIFSFDNVPANIFNGRKHGIFNTNCANAVRAAITVVENKPNIKGFKISPLIRFLTDERKNLLTVKSLMKLLPNEYQVVSNKNKKYHKCFIKINDIYKKWIEQSNGVFSDLLSKKETEYKLCIPTTCRYFLSATERELNRGGKNTFYFKNQQDMEYAYCLLNSSFAYWYWRLFDGGITYPTGLLKTIPIKNSFSKTELKQLHMLVSSIKVTETNYLVYKKNASEMQENIKFPIEIRDKFNDFILSTFGINADLRSFDCIHSNNIFGGNINE